MCQWPVIDMPLANEQAVSQSVLLVWSHPLNQDGSSENANLTASKQDFSEQQTNGWHHGSFIHLYY